MTIKNRLGRPGSPPMTALLEVTNLCVSYTARDGVCAPALSGTSFALQRGQILGVLGESGSGKSTLAAALLRILPPHAKIQHGSIYFDGDNLLQLESREMEKIRGRQIALIVQEPSLALHPTIRVGEQIADVIAAHLQGNRRSGNDRVWELLAAVFPTDSPRIARSYPHQLSGGQRARVLIALALSCNPSLIVADEPTASLDPETQQEIISLFRRLQRDLKSAVIWITHNPTILAGFADHILMLYAGRAVEIGPAESVLSAPRHPYTRTLFACLPPGPQGRLATHKRMLPVIPGEAPFAILETNRCSFEPRCNERMAVCSRQTPQMVRLESRHEVSCFRYEPESGGEVWGRS